MNTASTTTESTVNFDLNGKVTRVTLPGNQPIGPGNPGSGAWSNWGFSKAAYTLSANSTDLRWSVILGTKTIADAANVTFDGSRKSITLHDKLGEGAKFDTDLSKYRLVLRNSEGRPDVYDKALTLADGTDLNTEYGDYDLTFNIEGEHAVFTVTGPIEANANYQLVYHTQFIDDTKPKPGFYYTNEIILVGTDLKRVAKHRYEHAVNISIQMEDGYGAMQVTKKITGEAAAMVDAELEFPVTIAYELPAGTTEQDYPDWGDKKPTTNPFTVTVKAGQTLEVPFHFPHGTKVTVSEPGLAGSLTVDGKVVWGAPLIKVNGVGDSDTVMLSIVDQRVSEVEITNRADVPPTPPATPPTPEKPVEPKPEPKPKTALAKTGAEGLWSMTAIAVAAVTLGAGAVYGASRSVRRK